MAGLAIFEVGKRLKHVKENDLVHGEWESYCSNTLEITPAYANRYIKVATELGDSKLRSGANIGFKSLYEIATMPPEELGSSTSRNLGVEALYLIATMPPEEREKEHTLSSGETKTVDEMTQRELQEVKRKHGRHLENRKFTRGSKYFSFVFLLVYMNGE